ncbi:M23 family metallopeptidase [Patescibacteria group bacterium]|nr:M23 family metallopeptidase [Patescibacteria group bacterium]
MFLVAILIVNASSKDSSVITPAISNILSEENSSQSSCSTLCQGEEKKHYPDLFSIQDNSLLAVSASTVLDYKALASLGAGSGTSHNETGVEEYVIQKGDTISSVAQQFDISAETILWANNLTAKSTLIVGKTLIILPVTGAMYIVQNGDTISEIARDYKASQDGIIAFNNLPENGTVVVGDILIIPGGVKPALIKTYSAPTTAIPNSYFIVPVPSPWRITRGLHSYNAIDFSTGECGSPIFAAAQGEIQRTGWDKQAGNYVRILHPNGVVTFYGHMSKIAVSAGQKVSQGQIIGYIGYSGHTIPAGPGGCHLHFEVRGAVNPFAKLALNSWY